MTWRNDIVLGFFLGCVLALAVVVGVNAAIGVSVASGAAFWVAWIAMSFVLRRRRTHDAHGDGWHRRP